MAIQKKLIVFKKKENFLKELQQGNILDSSWVVIKDTNELYVKGVYIGGLTDITATNVSLNEITIQSGETTIKLESDNVQDVIEELLQIILDNEQVTAEAFSQFKEVLGVEDEISQVNFKGQYIDGISTFKEAIETLNDVLEENLSFYDDTEIKNDIQDLKDNKVNKTEYTKIVDSNDNIIKEIQFTEDENEEIEVYTKTQCDERFALKGETSGESYDDTEIKERLTALEGKEDFDDTELKQNIQDLKTNKADKSELGEKANKSDLDKYAEKTDLKAEKISLEEVSIEDISLKSKNLQDVVKELFQSILDDEAIKAEAIKALKDLIGENVTDDLTLTFNGEILNGETTVESAIDKLDEEVGEIKSNYLKIWQGSEEDYNSLGEYDNNTIYVIQ